MNAIQHTDRELLRAWLNGRESAFGELVDRHAGLVFSVAVRQIGDRNAAEEVVQDVFSILARKARALVNHPSVPAWLHITSRNIARREKAKLASHDRKLRRLGEEIETEKLAESGAEECGGVDFAIAKLPVPECEAIVLRFFEDCDYSEISGRLSISEVAARKRVSRGLRKLEKLLMQDLGEGARLATMAIPIPAALVASIISSTSKAGAGVAGGTLATFIGIITMNTLTKTSIVSVVGAGLAWFGISNYSKRLALEDELQLARSKVAMVTTAESREGVPAETSAIDTSNLEQQLAEVTAERDDLNQRLAELNEAVGDLSQDVVVNLGRIQDLGGNYARLMVEAQGLVARFADENQSTSAEERQELMKEFLQGASDITAAVPEIIGFEEQPKDMSRFFQSLYQELAEIDEAQAQSLAPVIERLYTDAIEQRLTMKAAPKLNADEFDEWKGRRDAFFAEGRAELLELLPAENRSLFEERIDVDSLWPRDMNVGQLPLVFNPAGDTAAKVYRQMEKLTQGQGTENPKQ